MERLGAQGGVPTGLSRSAGQPRPHAGGEGEMGRAAERAEREAGRPNIACPLSLF